MPKPIEAMHHFFGKKLGKRCAECPNLVEEYRGDRKVRKCRAYGGYYNSKADWALKYEACGLIEAIALGPMLTNAQKAKFMKDQNRWLCWYVNDEWGCYIIAPTRGRAKSLFNSYWDDICFGEYTDVRATKIKAAEGYEEAVLDMDCETLAKLDVHYRMEE